MEKIMMITFLSTKQFAERTCTAVQTIYNKIANGELIEGEHFYKNGKLRFPDSLVPVFARGDKPLPSVLNIDSLPPVPKEKNKKDDKTKEEAVVYINRDAL